MNFESFIIRGVSRVVCGRRSPLTRRRTGDAPTFVVNGALMANQWRHRRGTAPCTHQSTPNTRQDRPQAPFFKSSVRRHRESNLPPASVARIPYHKAT